MNTTEKTLIVILALILLVIFGVAAWKYQSIAQQDNSAIQTILTPASTTTAETVTSDTTASATTGTIDLGGTTTVATSVTPTPVVPSRPSPITIVPQAGWTTYNEGQYVVAGTYPQSWYEYDAVGFGGSLQFTSAPMMQTVAGGFVVSGAAEITIYRTPETVTQAQAEDLLNGTVVANTTATVAGETVSVIGYNTASTENTVVTYVPHGGYVYRIVLAYHGEQQFGTVYSNFIASFRFTN
jgi:hypothetical protein